MMAATGEGSFLLETTATTITHHQLLNPQQLPTPNPPKGYRSGGQTRDEGPGSGRRGLDADEMDDVGRGDHAKGMLTTCGSGVGGDFQRRSPAETVRSSA